MDVVEDIKFYRDLMDYLFLEVKDSIIVSLVVMERVIGVYREGSGVVRKLKGLREVLYGILAVINKS